MSGSGLIDLLRFPAGKRSPSNRNGQWTQHFIQERYQRNVGIACLLFFVAMMAFPICLAAKGGCNPYLLWLSVAFWGFWIGLSVIILLAYWRESLAIDDKQLVQRGIVRCRCVKLNEITHVRWRIAPVGGSVVLRSAFQRIKIELNSFEPEERRWLIRMLRLSLSPSIQSGWEQFCLRIALPLSKPHGDVPLKDDEVLLARHRLDRTFLWLVLLALVVGVVSAWQLHGLRLLLLPLAPVVVWVLIRQGIPREGVRDRKVSVTPEKGFLLFLLVWGIIGVAAILLLPNTQQWAMVGILIVWMTFLLLQAHRVDRHRKSKEN